MLAEQAIRDQRDTERDESPLRAAADAITVDTSDLTLDEAVERVVALVRAVAALSLDVGGRELASSESGRWRLGAKDRRYRLCRLGQSRLPPGGSTHSLRANSAPRSGPRSATAAAPAASIVRASSDQPRAIPATRAVPKPTTDDSSVGTGAHVGQRERAERLGAALAPAGRRHRTSQRIFGRAGIAAHDGKPRWYAPSAAHADSPHFGIADSPPLRIARSVSAERSVAG